MADGINYSSKLIQSLELSLRSAFNQPHLELTQKPHKPGGGFYVFLEKGDRIAQTDDGGELTVLPILTSSGEVTTFYFAFVATFRFFVRDYDLQHASLIVFHDICAGELVPLFRAEWDYLAAADTTSKHAQPHWHFVQRPERIEGIVRALIDPSPDFTAGEKSELFGGHVDYGKFHFAMTSLGRFQKQVFQSDDFPKWFRSLTNYIAEQIDYLLSKTSPATTQDFVPGA